MLIEWAADIKETAYYCVDKPAKLLTPIGQSLPWTIILPGNTYEIESGLFIKVEIIDLEGNQIDTISGASIGVDEENGTWCVYYDGENFNNLENKQCYSIRVTVPTQSPIDTRPVERVWYYKFALQAVNCCLPFFEWKGNCFPYDKTKRLYFEDVLFEENPNNIRETVELSTGIEYVLGHIVQNRLTMVLRNLPPCIDTIFQEMVVSQSYFINKDRRRFCLDNWEVGAATYDTKRTEILQLEASVISGDLLSRDGCCNVDDDQCYYPEPIGDCEYCPFPELEVVECTENKVTIDGTFGDELWVILNSLTNFPI